MQNIVIIANGAAYGSESLFNSLRLAIALREQQDDISLKLFLMSDAVTAGIRGQKPAEGYNIQQMLEILTAQNVPVKLCKTCTDGRGVTGLPLIDGVEIGTLVELAQWTLAADKVLTLLNAPQVSRISRSGCSLFRRKPFRMQCIEGIYN